MINWKVRIKNKAFWLAMVPAVLLLVQVVLSVFNIVVDFGELGNKLKEVINALFAVLVLSGVVIDPTTKGIADSAQAMGYDTPKEEK